MRGGDQNNGSLFSYVDLEERVPKAHPLRTIRNIVNDVLGFLSSDFEALYSPTGRPSVPPEKLFQDRLTKTGKRRKTKIDGRTTRHPGYGVSQRCRKRIEEIFGWAKTQAGLSKTKFRGKRRVDASFTLALAAYNLIRLPRLLAEVPP